MPLVKNFEQKMSEKINKILSFALVFVMMLNYVMLIAPVKPKHHCINECRCGENCGCGCKGKVVLSPAGSVCLDAVGCGCSMGENIPDFSIKEGLISKIEIFHPLSSWKFLNHFKKSIDLVSTDDIFHPPDNFA